MPLSCYLSEGKLKTVNELALKMNPYKMKWANAVFEGCAGPSVLAWLAGIWAIFVVLFCFDTFQNASGLASVE